MFGFITSIKAAVYNMVLSSYNMFSSRQQNAQEIESENKVTLDVHHVQIASRIYIATNKTWRIYRHTASRAEHMCDVSTLASFNDNDNKRTSSLETDDILGCGEEDKDQEVSLVKALESKTASLEQQLSSKEKAFEALEELYIKQFGQRLKDEALVDQACKEVLRMKTHCREIQIAHKKAEEFLQDKVDQQQSQIEAKDKELANLIDNHHSVLEVVEKFYTADLVSATRKAEEERRRMEAEHLKQVRVLTEASKTNRSAWEEAKQSMEFKMKQMDRDFKDNLQANKDEITRVTELSYRLAAENRLLASTLDLVPAEEMHGYANEVFEEVRHTREELDKTYTKLKIANDKIENILETTQQERDHWEAHGAEEKVAQAQVYDLQNYIIELQEKLRLRDDLLRATDSSCEGTTTTTTAAETISKIVFDNDELREKLSIAREENVALQTKVNKVDDENCALCMKLDTTEADLYNAQERIQMLEEKQSLINKEHELLFMAVENDGALTTEDKNLLQEHLRETTAANEYLRGCNIELRNVLTEAKEFAEIVEDKCSLEVDKAQKYADFWESLYWDEAVPKVERLAQEIHELNKELGRDNVHVQERLERNVVVADRNALRYACKYSLRGVDPNIIPAEVYEPGFVPGWIPATHDALRTLRPLGWALVAELGKVWLAPMYKPFTQEDAAYRLRAQHQAERKEHRAKMNAPPPPETDSEAPFDASSPHSSVRNAYNTKHTYKEPEAPAYKSGWMEKRSELTREAYENMDTDLKLGVLRMIGVELNPEDNHEEELF